MKNFRSLWDLTFAIRIILLFHLKSMTPRRNTLDGTQRNILMVMSPRQYPSILALQKRRLKMLLSSILVRLFIPMPTMLSTPTATKLQLARPFETPVCPLVKGTSAFKRAREASLHGNQGLFPVEEASDPSV